MRNLFLLVLSLSGLSLSAASFNVSGLPAPAFADREVSLDAALPAGLAAGGDFRVFRLEMELSATPSNSVQVALGRDSSPCDGRLGVEESGLVVGWDCGEWFLRPSGLKERYVCAARNPSGRLTLAVSVRLDAQGIPRAAAFRDGTSDLAFGGLVLSPFPGWLNPGAWTRLRVTSRGAVAPRENIRVVFAPDGARIIIK